MAKKTFIVPYLPAALYLALAFVMAACGGAERQGAVPVNTEAGASEAKDQPFLAPVISSATELGRGVWAEVHSTGSCLNVRTAPGLNAPIAGCQPDGATGQIIGGPEEREGHRWWRVSMDIPTWSAKNRPAALPGLIKGWASAEFLRFKSPGALEFRGLKLGEPVGDFTVEQIKILPESTSDLPKLTAVLSGEATIEGEYQHSDECGWSITPNEVSRAKLPRIQGLESGPFTLRESSKLELSRVLAPEAGAAGSYQGLKGKATVVISNYVIYKAATGCGRDFADLVRLVSKG